MSFPSPPGVWTAHAVSHFVIHSCHCCKCRCEHLDSHPPRCRMSRGMCLPLGGVVVEPPRPLAPVVLSSDPLHRLSPPAHPQVAQSQRRILYRRALTPWDTPASASAVD